MVNIRILFRVLVLPTFTFTTSAATQAQTQATRGDNRFVGNAGSSAVTVTGVQSHDPGRH